MSSKQEARQIAIANATLAELKGEIICDRCGARVENYPDLCKTDFAERCPGFDRYDEVRRKHERLIK